MVSPPENQDLSKTPEQPLAASRGFNPKGPIPANQQEPQMQLCLQKQKKKIWEVQIHIYGS